MKRETRPNAKQVRRLPALPTVCLVLVGISIVPWCSLAQSSNTYDEATKALDARQYQKALDLYREAERLKGRQSDAAVYWQAWIQYKLARERDALNNLDRLESAYPDSRWLDDAAILRAEISGEISSEEEIKLMAIAGILNTDPERAADELEKLLQGNGSTAFKEQALFLLVQTGSPDATEIMVGYARDASDPTTQRVALRTLVFLDDANSRAAVEDVYLSSSDVELKAEILQSWAMVGDERRLLEAARSESSPVLQQAAIEGLTMMGAFAALETLYDERKDPQTRLALLNGYMMAGRVEPVAEAARSDESPEVRAQAVQLLAMMGATEEIWALYGDEESVETKKAILAGLFLAGDVERLTEVATSEPNRGLRVEAIRGLGIASGDAAAGTLKRIYEVENDRELRSAVLDALAIQGNARELIAIARNETDPELRRDVVRHLSMMGSEEATAYLLELLEE
jgi:tetratricopeptide (TPR) repeat protein